MNEKNYYKRAIYQKNRDKEKDRDREVKEKYMRSYQS